MFSCDLKGLGLLACTSWRPACSCLYKAEKNAAASEGSSAASASVPRHTTALQPPSKSVSVTALGRCRLLVTMQPESARANITSCNRDMWEKISRA